jgi:hypothetical protein
MKALLKVETRSDYDAWLASMAAEDDAFFDEEEFD